MISLVLFGSFIVLILLSIPIGIALGISSLVAIVYNGKVDINYLVQNLTTSVDSFPLMAIPFFVLAGDLMGRGGISKRLLNLGNVIFGRYTGGLGIVTIVSCMFFAAISGSGPATVAAIGGLVIPEMIRKNYSKGFSSSLSATAGSIGVMIPPSIPMVIYGVSGGVSITTLFLAGFVPGIMVGLSLILWCYISSKINRYGERDRKYSGKEILRAANEAKWALLIPVIILGGIYGGIFTPTEAAAVAVIYGFVIGVFVYKDLKLIDVFEILKKSALTTATVLIILGTANTFGRILTLEQIPVKIANAITSISDSRVVILILINILLLFVGCFMDTTAAIIILTPILLPVAKMVGVDPVHFGIIMVVNLAIGFITPPLGVNLFVACGIGNISIEELSKSIIPWLFVMIFCLMMITFIPDISLFLPKLIMFNR